MKTVDCFVSNQVSFDKISSNNRAYIKIVSSYHIRIKNMQDRWIVNSLVVIEIARTCSNRNNSCTDAKFKFPYLRMYLKKDRGCVHVV